MINPLVLYWCLTLFNCSQHKKLLKWGGLRKLELWNWKCGHNETASETQDNYNILTGDSTGTWVEVPNFPRKGLNVLGQSLAPLVQC